MSKTKWGKDARRIEKAIKPYGLYIEKGRKHHKVRNAEGVLLLGFSGTPSDPHWYKNVINQLIKNGHLPGLTKW